MEQHAEPARGFNFSFDWSGNSKTISKGTTYTFTPPHYNGYACCIQAVVIWCKALVLSEHCYRCASHLYMQSVFVVMRAS